ncbi:hypothetical protein [Chroococcidiopsis cubana]|uniref:hypothetical protein n=1 Tax=Chroococcidiopsis cubana TaxID=171392 RepID=UPI001F540CC3|nr:hypothetical protein [Chroococcidiopsis cubana]
MLTTVYNLLGCVTKIVANGKYAIAAISWELASSPGGYPGGGGTTGKHRAGNR